ncbi:P-loop containing nucleoside triphosphate hydrolase protein [Microthyrium microscopicum]|uniref:P-loop containing nucleoside triphosphate hydrolase protein n=1 Tax=Microthyrium microscopicum TaxID=703497 RepID=A0A6A6UQD9_9PEZI|nr:P-loop containing nucleoside triphosphate hydrolase protein [Microthyrium microscopicum]
MAQELGVSILLLGDSDVGKSSFLARLTLGAQENNDGLPPYELPRLLDSNQPFEFNMHIRGNRHRFYFYDTSSPTNYSLIQPDVVILCYDISNRSSLESLGQRWRHELQTHFNYDEALPVIVLGLKRDLRREWTQEEREKLKGATIMPQEGLLMAQQMRCDMYVECSAMTGELFKEAIEDIAKTAGKKWSEGGGRTEGGCIVM